MTKGKGGKKKRRGKSDANFVTRELIKSDGNDQEYAQVVKLLGNARLEAKCFKKKNNEFTSKTRICLIRGKMRKRIWINANDLILVSLREYDDGKGDVIHKYEENEIKKLVKKGEIPNIVFNAHVTTEKNTDKNQENVITEDDITFNGGKDSDDSEYDSEELGGDGPDPSKLAQCKLLLQGAYNNLTKCEPGTPECDAAAEEVRKWEEELKQLQSLKHTLDLIENL